MEFGSNTGVKKLLISAICIYLLQITAKNNRNQLSKNLNLYYSAPHFCKGIDLYGGRKGFVDLMLSKGHALENISVWMRHSTLDRTWRSYKQRRKYHIVASA